MLIRKIIIPTSTRLEIDLPIEYIGKKIAYLVFDVEREEAEPSLKIEYTDNEDDEKPTTIEALEIMLEPFQVDMRNFKFDRDKANDYK